jgi:hypothetical protein
MACHGSPRRVRQGGRRHGTPKQAGAGAAGREDELLAAGDSPRAYMLGVKRDGQADPAMRHEAARTAVPYCDPRLSAVDVSNSNGGPLVIEIVKFARDNATESLLVDAPSAELAQDIL